MTSNSPTVVDLHSHTRGSDGFGSPAEIASNAVAAGVDVLCITDHHRTFTKEGQRVARAVAAAGIRAVIGCEYSTAQGHLMVFGVDVEAYDWGFYPEMQRVIDDVNDAGGVAYPSHPYKGYRKSLRDGIYQLRDIPCVEVANGQVAYQCPHHNRQAVHAAKAMGLPGVGGSDAHDPRGIGLTYTMFENEVRGVRDLIRELRAGSYRPVTSRAKRYQGFWNQKCQRRSKIKAPKGSRQTFDWSAAAMLWPEYARG